MGIQITRAWEMPSIWTFQLRSVQEVLIRYVGGNWVDPFAGENSPATLTNDIEDKHKTTYQMDALEFLTTLRDGAFNGVLFDPPYSVEQCLRRYTPKHGGTAGRAEYWAKCKDQIARVIEPGGVVISFGWDSVGMGKKRGFEIEEIKLICHGACHNDTIITIDRKGLGA